MQLNLRNSGWTTYSGSGNRGHQKVANWQLFHSGNAELVIGISKELSGQYSLQVVVFSQPDTPQPSPPMAQITDIQWCDSTVNPIMGCVGCELFPKPSEILTKIDAEVRSAGAEIESRALFKELVTAALTGITPLPSHKNAVNTTNIWHLREQFKKEVHSLHGATAAEAAELAIKKSVTCYAAKQHLNRGANITKPTKEPRKGHAPIFESVTQFHGRVLDAAKASDLLGRSNATAPWKDDLPRMIFVSDMGDAFSAERDFKFLKEDTMPAILSPEGKQHLWLWLTKQPERMAKFSEQIEGFPENVCAMTTVTSNAPESLARIDHLRKVKASIRGLSIEPLWNRLDPEALDLKDIDWVILGGESGSGSSTTPFEIEWAEELREHCRSKGVAFFLKQLGRLPMRDGKPLKLKDKHGGDWEEWDEELRVREFPKAFRDYRRNELVPSDEPRPGSREKKVEEAPISAAEIKDFKRLDLAVQKGLAAFIECGIALKEIKDRKLWKAGNHKTWEDYCIGVAGLSKSYALRIVKGAEIATELTERLPIGNPGNWIIPRSESQVRPLIILDDVERKVAAWTSAVEKAGGHQPTAIHVQDAVIKVLAQDQEGDGTIPEPKVTRSAQRADLIVRLKDVVSKKESWADVERLLKKLEELL